jgi:hypothetical protein
MLPLPVVLGINMPVNWYIVLPLSTWIIYLADHVIDVTRKEEEYPSPRHQFIKRNLRPIVALILVISVVIAWQVLHPFSSLLFITGLIMAALVGIHLLMVKINPLKRSFLNNKELAIATIYAAGIYAGPIVLLYQTEKPLLFAFGYGTLFWVVVVINLVLISLIELKWDEEMDNSSWIRIIGTKKATQLLYDLFIGSILLVGILFFFSGDHYASMLLSVYLVMIAGHFLIFRFQSQLQPYLVYRKLGEALFWLPAVVYLISL